MAKKATKVYFYGTGRRKNAVACVRLLPGTGKITINDKDMDDYFGLETLKLIVRQPLVATATEGKFDIICKAIGGGISGQAGAIRHGISRALVQADEEAYKAILKKAGFLTRDARMKERKKPGLKKARKASSSVSVNRRFIFGLRLRTKDKCFSTRTVPIWSGPFLSL